MANIKLTELDAITTLASADVLAAVDVSADTTHKITTTNLFRTLPDGTAAAPALSFASDQDLGLYRTGANGLAISTGGTQRVTVDGSGNVTISGDLTVSGATTTVESTTVTIDDKNIELGSVATPTDTTADGGGITLKGATDKEIKWVNSTGYWTFNTGIEVGGNIQIDDNSQIRIGTDADLKLYHSGTGSVLSNSTGGFVISNSADDDDIVMQTDNGSGGVTTYLRCDGSIGSVRLHHYGTEKLRTVSTGIDVFGEVECDSLDVDGGFDVDGGQLAFDATNNRLNLADSVELRLGTGSDLRIYHNGTNSHLTNVTGGLFIDQNLDDGDIQLRTDNGSGSITTYVLCDGSSGSTKLFHYGSEKLATQTYGIDVQGEVQCDSLDVDGAADITGNVTLHANLDLQDNDQLNIGSGDDFTIRHNGTDSILENDTGHLYISNFANDKGIFLRSDDGSGAIANYIYCNGDNGEVKLYHYGNQKLVTKIDGIDVTGEVQCDSLDVDGNADIAGDIFISGGNKTVQTTAGFLQVGTSGAQHLAFLTNGTERGRVDSSGRLMLGTTTEGHSTADLFTIASSSSNGMTIRSGSSSSGQISFSDATTGDAEYRGQILYDHGGDFMRFRTAAVERFRITSTGAWAIEGASNYGTSGQVLTSNGNDAPTWQDAGSVNVGGASAISMNDNVKINFGASSDLQIYHDTDSRIDSVGSGTLAIRQLIDDADIVLQSDNSSGGLTTYLRCDGSTGEVKLYTYGAEKLRTKTDGVNIEGELQCDTLDVDGGADITGNVILHANLDLQDNDYILLGSSDDFKLFHNGSNSHIENYTGGLYIDQNLDDGNIHLRSDNGSGGLTDYVKCQGSSGEVFLYHYGSQKFKTKSDGVDVTGEVQCDSLDCDGAADFTGDATFRGGAAAVNIAANSDIRMANGNWTGDHAAKIQHHGNWLYIQGGSSGHIFRSSSGSDRVIIDSSGHLRPAANNTYDLGTSSLRWRNIYTNDLNLSNEGSTNDVDGTWGNYTIQEGEDDLFLINRRNGKKYKFNLTEVS